MADREKTSEPMVRLGEAAKLGGVTVQQLQYYILVGVVEPSAVSAGHQRLFNRQNIQQIKMVHLLNRSGYGLREIREIFMRPKKTGRGRNR